MRTKILIVISLFAILLSCQNSDWQSDNSSIRPINGLSEKHFSVDDFVELSHSQIDDYNFWLEMNHSNYEFGVKIENEDLIIGEPTYNQPFFGLEDGKLEIINRGEFGGALNFISKENPSDTISIWDVPINYVFNFKGEIYFVVGIAHLMDSGGAIFKLNRDGNKFTYNEVVRLDSAPEAIAIYKEKILIAGHRMFTVVDNFEKENLIEEALWSSLYPNSIAVKNDDEVYIGMRDGYSKVSLIDGNVKYYKYKGN